MSYRDDLFVGKDKELHFEDMKVLQVNPLHHFGSPLEIVAMFGGKKEYLEALSELENEIYMKVA